MNFEYKMLVVMTFFFLFAWLPSSVAKFKAFGGKWLASNRRPVLEKELAPWGARAERAYSNLKDFYPGFVVAILLLGNLNKFNELTAWAAGLYVFARLTHYIAYTAGNVTIRFLAYILAMSSNAFLLVKVLC
jgi:uncharacterized MAPEG superfamily protein